jgi:hypothetical protein
VTGLTGDAQLILRAESVVDVLGVIAEGYIRTEKTGLLEQVNEPKALIRFPVIVFPCIEGLLSPPARMKFFIAFQSLLASYDSMSAARPVTCGVAMDVPE